MECANKLYVPRFFGVKQFGQPNVSKLSDGIEIDLKFKGTMRDYQENIVKKFKQIVLLNISFYLSPFNIPNAHEEANIGKSD